MILGLDVGGTQTDAVLMNGTEVLAATKTPTGDNLLETLRTVLRNTVGDLDPMKIDRMVFSTTMATNAIVQDRLEPTGMIVSGGPGIDPASFAVGPSYHVVEGCLDHQGFEAMPLNRQTVMESAAQIHQNGIESVGVVTKFSVRNPAHEIQIKDWIAPQFSHVALGHRVSGILNFPRRIATTYLNAALHHLHHRFSHALVRILDEGGLHAPRFLLKPDGGTLDLDSSTQYPARTAQSGPAASVMGALALDGCADTVLVLDIGGTTTDMSVVLNGDPLRAPYGIRLGRFPTLIRSLLTRSIGLGGDSEVRRGSDRNLVIGPIRQGPPVALGGPAPTPTDALIALHRMDLGDRGASVRCMADLGGPLGWDAEETAEQVLHHMADAIADAANAFVTRINSRPVYTIHEVLKQERVQPASAVIIGGPAPQLAPYVGRALGLPHRVPHHFGVANAVGAALARVTAEVTLQADTQRGTVTIPEACLERPIDGGFDIEEAVKTAREALREQAVEMGADPENLEVTIPEQQVFNMIRGLSRAGRNIRLRMCIAPGLIPEWHRSR